MCSPSIRGYKVSVISGNVSESDTVCKDENNSYMQFCIAKQPNTATTAQTD